MPTAGRERRSRSRQPCVEQLRDDEHVLEASRNEGRWVEEAPQHDEIGLLLTDHGAKSADVAPKRACERQMSGGVHMPRGRLSSTTLRWSLPRRDAHELSRF